MDLQYAYHVINKKKLNTFQSIYFSRLKNVQVVMQLEVTDVSEKASVFTIIETFQGFTELDLCQIYVIRLTIIKHATRKKKSVEGIYVTQIRAQMHLICANEINTHNTTSDLNEQSHPTCNDGKITPE